MSDLEQMLRDALHETPTSAPRSADPIPAIERRVRRLRVVAAVSLSAAAAVAAAVVVPMSVGTSGHARVQILDTTPTPAPSPTPSASANVTGGPQPTLVWMGANWVASAPSGLPWMLYDDGSGADGGTRIARLTPPQPQAGAQVQTPADQVLPGQDVVWVVGATHGGTTMSRVDAMSTSGAPIASKALPGELLSSATVTGDDLYVVRGGSSATAHVDRLQMVGGRIETATVAVPQAKQVVATAGGEVWAQTPSHLVRITSTGSGISTSTTVIWSGDIIGTDQRTGDQAFWTWDGSRVVQLTPSLLSAGSSVAQGDRLLVPGHAAIAVTAPGGGLYLSIVEGAAPGIYYYPADQLGSGQPQPGAIWHEATAGSICVDPRGGVDITSADGVIYRWDPAS
ncbi:MAG TPA: hypothetical protein VFH54_14825 [Mycobacteriales bacterium]|nr:hypothetical protein [Mycobacteriales bacterium]